MTKLIDELDRKILSIIQCDARTSFAEVAKKLDVSEGTIHIRVKKLQQNGVIKGFCAVLSPEKLDKNIMAFIAININSLDYKDVASALAKMPDVHEIHEVTGEFYSILKVRTKDKDSLANIIDDIRAVKGVLSTHTMLVLKTEKEQLPMIT